MNNLQIFNNNEFGQIRMVEVNNKPYAVASDIAKSLGYKDQTNAIKQHCKWVVKHHIPHPQSKTKTLEVNVIPEGDIYRLVSGSELPSAEKFENWVFDEVLPTIRKTGTYKINNQQSKTTELEIKNKNAEARLKNSQTRQATFLLDQSKKYSHLLCKEAMSLLVVNALEMVAGKNTLPRPKTAEHKYYSATEIAELAGVSANKVGKVANANNLKTDEYGLMTLSQSLHSVKQVATFVYNEAGKDKLLELLGVA